jgi:transcriptional regulator with XRE-family HTH domain
VANLKGIRFATEKREEMRTKTLNLYADGYTMQAIAKIMGCAHATVSLLLKESGVGTRPHDAALPEGMISAKDAAEVAGIGHPTFNALRHRGEGPPCAERPDGAHGHYTYYWRKDVERWVREREARKRDRGLRQRLTAEARQKARESQPLYHYVPDWDALMEAVDLKRVEDGLKWEEIAIAACLDPAQMSRFKNGRHAARAWNSYFRLWAWVNGGLPPELDGYVLPAATSGEAGQ